MAEAGVPKRRECAISVAVPASIVSDVPHMREKTAKIGVLARGADIFGVDEVVVYLDSVCRGARAAQELVCKVLDYASTPQYLRKRLFRDEPELRFAGILPPLRTPDHPLVSSMSKLRAGEYREGVVLKSGLEWSLVDVGVERPLRVRGKLGRGSRATIVVTDPARGVGEAVERERIEVYWGFRVSPFASSLGSLISQEKYDAVIATSRHGRNIVEIWEELSSLLASSKRALILFGSPKEGVADILRRENVNLEGAVEAVVNTVPHQGTATIRTEEAVISSLAVLNAMMEGMKLGS
ncbi:MAG: hypothetical protein JTT11_06430 [Candidatus Brockarchaeota archaeon]|nr:hypothetical protein [Candidatus Brockarchaeota archaeon]